MEQQDREPGVVSESDPAYELSARGKTLLQERLAIEGLVLVVVASCYWLTFFFTWRGHPGLSDGVVLRHVFSPFTFALLFLHASLWSVCRRKALPRAWLLAADVVYHAAVGLVLVGVMLHHPAPVMAPIEVLLALTALLSLRALLVPSSAMRTALIGIAASLVPALALLALPGERKSDIVVGGCQR